MKKISHITSTALILLALLLIPLKVHAQTPIEIDGDSPTTSSTLDTDTTTDTSASEDTATEKAGAPETGFAPSDNKVLTSTAVFIGGAALGGLVGFGLIQLKKRNQNS